MKLLDLPDELIFNILDYLALPNHHQPFLHNPLVQLMANFQSINKDLSKRIEHYSNTFWKSLLLKEFGSNKQFIKLIDDVQQQQDDLKRKAILLRKLARMYNRQYPIKHADEPLDDIRMCIVGPIGNGKSSICDQFIFETFPEVTDPTIEDGFRKNVIVDGHPFCLYILDTAGNESDTWSRDAFIRTIDCFIITTSFDTTPTQKEKYYEELFHQIACIKDKGDGFYFPFVFVVNKSDLQQEERKSTFEMWENYFNSFIDQLGIINYEFIETSAKSNINVSKIFELVSKMFLHYEFPHLDVFQEVIKWDSDVFEQVKEKFKKRKKNSNAVRNKKKCILQ